MGMCVYIYAYISSASMWSEMECVYVCVLLVKRVEG